MEENKKEVKQKEVKDPKVVKPVNKLEKYTFNEDVGTTKNGKIRYEKGKSYGLTQEQIVNYKKHNLICQI